MEIVGGILVGLVVLTLLAAVGITTVVAFGLMGLLGLVTEMSFKRVFFVSFIMALAAPILLGIAGFAALEDGSFEHDLRDSIGESFVLPEDVPAEWREAFPRVRDLREDLREGRIDSEQFERELEQVITDATGAQIEVDGINLDEIERIEADEVVRIERE